MQKNKIDIVKAVCNVAAKKLAVLSLAVTVSGGVVTYAQISEDKANRQLQVPERMNEETLQERLRRLERERDEKLQQYYEKRKQAEEKRRQNLEKSQQSDEKYQQSEKKRRQSLKKFQQAEEKHLQSLEKSQQKDENEQRLLEEAERLYEERIRLLEEAERLSDEAKRLYEERTRLLEEADHLYAEVMELGRQIAALRAQIAHEQQEEPVEEIVEIVPEDDEMKEETHDPQRRNRTPVGPSVFLQNRTVFELGATAQDTLRNLIRTMSPQTVSQVMREFSGQN